MMCLCGLPVNLVAARGGHRWVCPACGYRDREQLATDPKETE